MYVTNKTKQYDGEIHHDEKGYNIEVWENWVEDPNEPDPDCVEDVTSQDPEVIKGILDKYGLVAEGEWRAT